MGNGEDRNLTDAIEDSLVRSVVASRLDGLVQEVAANVCDEAGTLVKEPKVLSDSSLKEQPVWGLDAYTRYNIRMTLEGNAEFRRIIDATQEAQQGEETCVVMSALEPDPEMGDLDVQLGETLVILERASAERWRVRNSAGSEGMVQSRSVETKEAAVVTLFIENILLPMINRLPQTQAYNMRWVLDAVIKTAGLQLQQALQAEQRDHQGLQGQQQPPPHGVPLGTPEATAAPSTMASVGEITAEDSMDPELAMDQSTDDGATSKLPTSASSASSLEPLDDRNKVAMPHVAMAGATILRDAMRAFGTKVSDEFRIHPKGTGVVVANPAGVKANELVSEYIGELYAPWRWLERQDAVAAAQKSLAMPHALPDFYNIVLERPSNDGQGYGLWFVDASSRANFASSLSHSCTPNCEPRMAVRNGRLTIVLVTLRDVECGEELTFDYGAVTTNETEFKMAICLCGTSLCRQSFLHFVAAASTQQLLTR